MYKKLKFRTLKNYRPKNAKDLGIIKVKKYVNAN